MMSAIHKCSNLGLAEVSKASWLLESFFFKIAPTLHRDDVNPFGL